MLYPYLILLCVMMVMCVWVSGQSTDSLLNLRLPVIDKKKISIDSLMPKPQLPFSTDSTLISARKTIQAGFDSAIQKMKRPSADSISKALYKKYFPSKPLLVFGGGFVNYNFSCRSNIDTPYVQAGVYQNLLNANMNVLVSEKFPVRVSVAVRNTNSFYFRNYIYVNAELNTGEFRRLQAERLRGYFNEMVGQLMDPNLKQQLSVQENRWKTLAAFLQKPDLIKKFLQSKETIIHEDDISGTPQQKDSILKEAKEFVGFYEQSQTDIKKIEKSYDSLKSLYAGTVNKISGLQQIFNKNIYATSGSEQISKSLHEADIYDDRFDKMSDNLFAIRKFSIGQTMPDYTELTVKNIGVSGVNIEYNNNKLYAAVVAGALNFEARDFVLSGARPAKQYVAAGRLGWGKKEGDHLILTVYDGKKQLFNSQTINSTTGVLGMSLEGQYVATKNIRLTGEIAQSALQASPYILQDTSKSKFSLNDKTTQAWSLGLHAYFPLTKTGVDGFYQFQGINFQCFNAYKVNANTSSWNIKADQYLFSGSLHLIAAIQRNAYANPLIFQNYNTNASFVTAVASYHHRGWPTLSVGYIPASQYSIVNDQTYENRYQTFNININHYYSLGTAKAITTIMFNHFYNSQSDSGFVYYNAHNLFASQSFIFTAYNANIGISHTQNSQYTLDVLEAGFGKTIKRNNSIGLGVKLNHLNTNQNELGYYITAKATIKEVGQITASGERTYLPGFGNTLVSSSFFNLGFMRYFK